MTIINVIEIKNGICETVKSFPVLEPKKEYLAVGKAEALYRKCILENAFDQTEEDLEVHIENGYFEDNCGYEIKLIWSTIMK